MGAIKDPQSRLAYVVEQGRKKPRLEPELRTETHRVEGCLSNLWLVAECQAGKCFYKADSDSAIVRGIACILCDFYSGASPQEILASDPAFLGRVGITQHLTPNRRNALSRVWEKIQAHAQAALDQ